MAFCSFKGIVTIIVATVVLLNLYILLRSGNDKHISAKSIDFQICEKHVHIKFGQTPLTAQEIQVQWRNQGHGRMLFTPKPNKNYLTIGIPLLPASVSVSDVLNSLQSLIKQSSLRQQTQNTIILFLLGTDPSYNQQLVNNVTETFLYHINIGFLGVVEVPSTHRKLFVQDADDSRRGGAHILANSSSGTRLSLEQAAGFSFMYNYVHNNNISQHFLQLSGREICYDDYLEHIRVYADSHGEAWSMLDFSRRHFVGTVFRTKDLPSLGKMLVLFWDQIPAKYLLALFCISKLQNTEKLRQPPLFLDIDRNVDYQQDSEAHLNEIIRNAGRIIPGDPWLADNPSAHITTNMTLNTKTDLSTAYKSGLPFDVEQPKDGDWLIIIFEKSQQLERVVIETGSYLKPNNVLHHGKLEVSSSHGQVGSGSCANYSEIGQFTRGRVEAEHLDLRTGLNSIKCLRILVTTYHTGTVTFSKIAVFLVKMLNMLKEPT